MPPHELGQATEHGLKRIAVMGTMTQGGLDAAAEVFVAGVFAMIAAVTAFAARACGLLCGAHLRAVQKWRRRPLRLPLICVWRLSLRQHVLAL